MRKLLFLTTIFLVSSFAKNDMVVTDDVTVLKPAYGKQIVVNERAESDSIIINDNSVVVNFEKDEDEMDIQRRIEENQMRNRKRNPLYPDDEDDDLGLLPVNK